MLTIILGIAIVVAMAWYLIATYQSWGSLSIGDILTSLVVGALGVLVSLFILAIVGAFALSGGGERVVAEEKKLSALNTGNEVSGSFFLGSGVIDSEPSYQFIVEREDGGFELDSVAARNVVVYEDATPSTARFVTYDSKYNVWWYFPGEFNLPTGDSSFHIPPGSVVQSDYSVSVSD